jgi:NhaP-type Na+/H+ and K+/H+ antiporter
MKLKFYKLKSNFSTINIKSWSDYFEEYSINFDKIVIDVNYIITWKDGNIDVYFIWKENMAYSLSDFKILTETLKVTGFFWDYLEDDREVIKKYRKIILRNQRINKIKDGFEMV